MLHVDKFGAGDKSLVLIPGLASGPWVWYATIAKRSPDCTIYAITLPGFDGRAAVDEKSLFAAFGRDFWQLLDAHKIEKPIIIGHSLGGTLGIALAEEHPDRLAGVISVDGMPVFPTVAKLAADQRQTVASQISGMFASQSKDDEFAAQKNFMSTAGTNKPELVEPAAKLESRSDPKAIAAWLQEDLTTDLRPDLNKISIPLLVFMPSDPDSAKSPLAPSQDQLLAFYKDLLKGAPQATVVPISPARHFAMLDQPEEFDKAVTKFLSSTWQ